MKDQLYGGKFIRSIIDIDRQTAIRKFEDLLNIQQLNSGQMDATESIITYICKQGDITPKAMM